MHEPMPPQIRWYVFLPVLFLLLFVAWFSWQRGGAEGAGQDTTDSMTVRQAEEKAFINAVFPVVSSWNAQAIRPLMSDITQAQWADADMDEVLRVLDERLGMLQSFGEPVPVPAANPATASEQLRHFRFSASYAGGQAEVTLSLLEEADARSLYAFNISVPGA